MICLLRPAIVGALWHSTCLLGKAYIIRNKKDIENYDRFLAATEDIELGPLLMCYLMGR